MKRGKIQNIIVTHEDITERKRAEKALEKSKQFLNETGRMAKVGGWELDVRTLEVSWTEETYLIHEIPLGYKPPWEKAIDFFHPDEREKLGTAIQKAIEHGEPYNMENRFITAKGKHLWTHTICQPIIVDGKTVKLTGTFQDITERKQAENALRENEKKYRTLFDMESDALALIDAETGNILEVNKTFINLYGYSRDEVLQMKNTDFSSEPDKTQKANHDRKEIIPIRWHKKKDGTVFPTEIAAKFFNYQGKDVNIVAIRDITKRNKTEEHLNFLSSITERISDSILVTNNNFEITYINKAFEKLYGYSLKELKGKTPDILNAEPATEKIMQELFETVTRGETFFTENRNKRKDGSVFYCEYKVMPLKNKNNEIYASTGIHRDITERKKAAEEKKRVYEYAAKQEKHALVGQIAGKMAHDFNNILGIVMGNTELSLLDCKDAATQKTLELIFEQTLRGRNLTKNLVAFAKDQEPKQQFFSVNKKIDLVLNLLQKDLERIDMIKEASHGIPDLLADPGMIEHALVNLLQNSIHAISMIERPKIIIRTFHKDKNIYFEIEDNGCGIPKKTLDRIYEPAFTMKGSNDITNSYKPGIKGTGYGMANVKKYIEQHKGNIVIDSKVGEGTRITINFPVIKKELTKKEIVELKKETLSFEKYILLVEDEPAISEVQYKILTHEPCNHKVDIVATAQMAVDLFNRNKYDFVSLDYILPGELSGMDVYNHIRKTNKTIPILFVSGNLDFLESIKELKSNDPWVEHVSKPCQNKDYVDSINKLLEQVLAEQ